MVQFTKLIDIPTFIISFSIGLLLTYLFEPNKKKIHVFPTPENMDKILIRDNNEMCFSFKAKEMKCPIDKSKIKGYPIQ